jgi:hypothetical protein
MRTSLYQGSVSSLATRPGWVVLGRCEHIGAVARSFLVIIWNLLSDPAAHFTDVGYREAP